MLCELICSKTDNYSLYLLLDFLMAVAVLYVGEDDATVEKNQ
jgi:hypothetical protein